MFSEFLEEQSTTTKMTTINAQIIKVPCASFQFLNSRAQWLRIYFEDSLAGEAGSSWPLIQDTASSKKMELFASPTV